jgi:hypothetical protein
MAAPTGKGVTPVRSVRISDDPYLPAKAIAALRGDSLADIIEAALSEYAHQNAALLNPVRTEIVAHRYTRRAAEAYVARFADELGDTMSRVGTELIPVRIAWTVEPATPSGFDVVSTVTRRAAKS